MAVRSVIDIDINDASFQRFASLFKRYQEQLAQSPGAWKKVSDAVEESLDKTTEGVENVGEATSEAAKSAQAMNVAFRQTYVIVNQQAEATRKRATGEVGIGHALDGQVRAWKNMATHAHTFAGQIADATKSLLRWGALTGLISGILGGGGLFGIDRLAAGAGNARRSALGLGVSPGEQRAFDLNYGRLPGSENILSGVNEALHDPRKIGALYNVGLSQRDIQGKDAAEVATSFIAKLKDLVDQTPENQLGVLIEQRHLEGIASLETLQGLKNTPASEIAGYGKQYKTDVGNLDLTKNQQKGWQDLQVQFSRSGETIRTGFERMLADLSVPLQHLSKSFTKLITDLMKNPHVGEFIGHLATRIEEFAKYLDKGELEKELINLTNKFIETWKNMGAFVGGVKKLGPPIETLWHTIDSVATSIAHVAHLVLDPFSSITGIPTEDQLLHPENAPKLPQTREEAERRDQGGDIPEFDWKKPWTYDIIGRLGHALSDPPGVRNNNPLNLSYRGQEGTIASDGRFGIYGTPEAGVAAAERQLLKYQAGGTDTLTKVIDKWAPPGDNDTAGYIAEVSKRTGIDPNQRLDFHDEKTASAIIAAMARRETGRDYDREVIQRGVDQGLGRGQTQVASAPKSATVKIDINNNTGGNSIVSASQLAVPM
jgi:hypothetical protein